MKGWLKTYRYGMETVIPLHGDMIQYDPQTQHVRVVLPILSPDESGVYPTQTVVQMLNTDELTVGFCRGCEHHGDEEELRVDRRPDL